MSRDRINKASYSPKQYRANRCDRQPVSVQPGISESQSVVWVRFLVLVFVAVFLCWLRFFD